MTVHVIFNVKLDAGSTRKARLVSYGHNLDTPTSMTYDSAVYRYIVRILLILAALNGLDVQCAYGHNAYLNTNPKEPIYFYAGEEFGKY